MILNKELKNAREKKKLTQIQIATKVGISETSYQRIEYGLQCPSLKTAMRIAIALNSTVEALFGVVPDEA